jgi:LmbE family N-acetylglucosaminyl deacetylase
VNKKILIIVAHPDDETIGCGGFISKNSKKGNQVYCASFTNGIGARDKFNKTNIKNRFDAAIKVSKLLKFKWVLSENFPDNKLDSVPILEIIKKIEKIKKKIDPDIIVTHHPYDLNIDHQIISQAVSTAFRPLKKERWNELLFFEVASATDYNPKFQNKFDPNLFINIKDEWKMKEKALKTYKNEITKTKTSRSIYGIKKLNELRGLQNGLKIAEAFFFSKKIVR